MSFTIDIAEIERAASDWQTLCDKVGAGMRPSVDAALLAARGAARNAAPRVTHRLENSIERKITGSTSDSAKGVLQAEAPYAQAVLQGTKPHEIAARRAQTLAFQSGGHTVFAKRVQHPGTKPNDFITPTGDIAEPKLESAELAVIDAAIASFDNG